MTIASTLVPELEQESVSTRRVLERIPSDRLAWRPHPKSYSIGQLGLHVALIPADLARMLANDELQLSSVSFGVREDATKAEIIRTFEDSLATGRDFLAKLTDPQCMATWRLMHGTTEVMAMPRIAVVRALMLNHLFHHRGQLQVYLRMLDIPVPVVYGATADENPFAALLAAP